MKYLTGSKEKLDQLRAEIDALEGLPRRATVFGGPDYLPRVYAPGAPGWTAHLCEAPSQAEGGGWEMPLPDAAEKHLGKVDLPDAVLKERPKGGV